jgi:hypothetical protein
MAFYSYYQLEMDDDFAGWGHVTLFYEVDEDGEISRQVEVFANGRVLLYDLDNPGDEHGELADSMPDHERYLSAFRISRQDFERAARLKPYNRKG